MKRACRKCKIITEEAKCPICNESDFSETSKGKIIILNPENSEIAKNLKIKKSGTYAIKTK